MKYTFIDEDGNSRTVNIDDAELANLKRSIGGTTSEAIQLWLFDNGYVENEVVNELSAKAKENKCGVGKVGAKKPRSVPKRKEDPTKRAIIQCLYEFIMRGEIDSKLMFDKTCAPVEITNPERVIAFSIGNDNYELTLSKKRKK